MEKKTIARNGAFTLEIRSHKCNTRYAFEQEEVCAILASRTHRG